VSQENVAIVRELNEAVCRGDWDAVARIYDPHICVRTDPSWPEQRMYGREAAINFVRNSLDVLGSNLTQAEIVDLGDRALVHVQWQTRARYSAIEEELRFSEVLTLRDGRVVLAEFFLDRAEALKAVCLEE
jgi:ketosteroid isomerase-like protein